MSEGKKNCWEIMGCGRGPDKKRKSGTPICAATVEQRLHGVHGGRLAGRACWIVAGTMCGGKPQGVFTEKYGDCKLCKFYAQVMQEEHSKFQLTMNLTKLLKNAP